MPKKVLLVLAVVSGVTFVAGRLSATTSPWLQPYRLSKLEWLAMTLEAQDRSECLTPAMATATDECIETHFSMRPPDAILVYGTTFGPVPISEWDKHVESVKGLVAESSKVFQLPPPKVEVLRRDGGSLRPLSHDR